MGCRGRWVGGVKGMERCWLRITRFLYFRACLDDGADETLAYALKVRSDVL